MLNETTIRPVFTEDVAVLASIIRSSLQEFGAVRPGTVYSMKQQIIYMMSLKETALHILSL